MSDNQDIAQKQISQAMSVEDARTLIREKFKLIVDDTDPVMIGVILHQGFIADYEKILDAHAHKLSKIVEQSTKESAKTIGQSLDLLKDQALKGTLENVLAGVTEKARDTEHLHQKILSFRKVCIVLTALQWMAVFTFFFILK